VLAHHVAPEGGSLVVEGPFYDTRGSTMAITGGTGAYSRARGVMHLQAHNDQGTAFRFGLVLRCGGERRSSRRTAVRARA
jgi:hypothetical protein